MYGDDSFIHRLTFSMLSSWRVDVNELLLNWHIACAKAAAELGLRVFRPITTYLRVTGAVSVPLYSIVNMELLEAAIYVF